MVTEVERVNNSVISSKYWGNPEFVLENMDKHMIQTYESFRELGQFYWIRDIAYLSGGYAGASGVGNINKYSLWYVRTSKPQVKDFQAMSGKRYTC